MKPRERIPLHDHSDNDSGGPITGTVQQIVSGGGTTTTAGGASVLNDLGDVDTGSVAPADGDALVYDSGTGLWAPAAFVPTITAADVAALGFVGEILIADSPSTPLVFADLLQNDAQDDLMYADL